MNLPSKPNSNHHMLLNILAAIYRTEQEEQEEQSRIRTRTGIKEGAEEGEQAQTGPNQ